MVKATADLTCHETCLIYIPDFCATFENMPLVLNLRR
jgi:hypothetical protein